MGVDYNARKLAKKRRKSTIDPELESEGSKRRRKNKVRRLCQGMCYGPPLLTTADAADSGDEEQAASPAPEAGPSSAQGLFGRTAAEPSVVRRTSQADAAADEEPPPKRKRSRKKPAAGAAHLSTAVKLNLPPPSKVTPAKAPAVAAGSDSAFAAWPEPIRRYMTSEGFEAPMPIQEKSWWAALAGRDVEAVAQPGTGKTLGYLLPVAAALVAGGHGARTAPAGPLALVLVPTRELAAQVAAVGRTLQRTAGLRCVVLFGGAERAGQVSALERRPHIVTATPGRLLDFVDDKEIDLGGVAHVVLDEADKMLSLGLRPQLERLRALLLPPPGAERAEPRTGGDGARGPGVRARPQVQLWTATMPDVLRAAAAQWLLRPRRVRASASAAAISRSVVQVVHVCAEHKKPAKLLKHLKQIQAAGEGQRNPPRVLIFVNRIKTARFVAGEVAAAGFRTALLHGDRPQAEREEAMRDFRSGKAQALVATDVAGRGLHIRNLPYVVNYDFPSRLEAYVHRVGRTGRLAAAGHAFSFFTRVLAPLAPALLALLQEHGQDVDPNLVRLAEAYEVAAAKLRAAPSSPQPTGTSLDSLPAGGGRQEHSVDARPAGPDCRAEAREDGTATQAAAKRARRPAAGDGGAEQEPASSSGRAPPAAPPRFAVAERFEGARSGCFFGRGALGMGYYPDPRTPADARPHAGGRGPGPGAAAHADTAPGTSGRPLPRRALRADLVAQLLANDDGDAAPTARRLPGLYRKRAGRVAEPVAPLEAGVQAAGRGARRAALPGRLRKKLAKAAKGQAVQQA